MQTVMHDLLAQTSIKNRDKLLRDQLQALSPKELQNLLASLK